MFICFQNLSHSEAQQLQRKAISPSKRVQHGCRLRAPACSGAPPSHAVDVPQGAGTAEGLAEEGSRVLAVPLFRQQLSLLIHLLGWEMRVEMSIGLSYYLVASG